MEHRAPCDHPHTGATASAPAGTRRAARVAMLRRGKSLPSRPFARFASFA